jgi:hypothetical protein
MTFLTTTSLSAALSGLVYVSSPLSTLYSSLPLALLGTALAAWRLAAKWTAEKRAWEDGVRERGRTALLECEDGLKGALEGKQADEGVMKEVEEGREAVGEVWDSLARMGE